MTTAPQQIAFDLPHRPAYGREDFFVSDNNAEAVAWIDRWPDWPAPVLVLCGPRSSGKTHLLSVWQEKSGAVKFDPAAAPETCVYVDDVTQYFGDAGGEQALFHLCNHVKEHQGFVLMTSEAVPGEWNIALPDLKSRLTAAPAVALREPDDGLLAAVLLKLFSDRQLRVGQEVLSYIIPRMQRSFADAADIVARIDKASLEDKRNITIPLVKKILER